MNTHEKRTENYQSRRITKRIPAVIWTVLAVLGLSFFCALPAQAAVAKPKRAAITLSVVNKSSVKITWKKVSLASYYDIYRSRDKGKTWVKISRTSRTYYTNKYQPNGTIYYRIRTVRKYKGLYYYGSYSSRKKVVINRVITPLSVGKLFGVERSTLLEYLESHEKDDYFIGTPYQGLRSAYPWMDCQRPTGGKVKASTGKYAMNCTGFVSYVFKACNAKQTWVTGGATLPIPDVNSGYDSNCYNWQSYLDHYGEGRGKWVQYYQYSSVKELMKDGRAQQGDLIMTIPTGWYYGRDWHIGFYWGEDEDGNPQFWNSTGKGHNIYNLDGQVVGKTKSGNQISGISNGSEPCVYRLYPMDVME